jgi:hypothetical protein
MHYERETNFEVTQQFTTIYLLDFIYNSGCLKDQTKIHNRYVRSTWRSQQINKLVVNLLWVLEGISTRLLFLSYLVMAANKLRFEDQLDGASNFLSRKARVILLLKEHDLWEIVERVERVVPTPTNVVDKASIEKKDIKSQRVIWDVVKDHLIPHVAEK